MAQTETGLRIESLTQQTGLPIEQVDRALNMLQRHDVVNEIDGRWQFTVELMRRWVAQR